MCKPSKTKTILESHHASRTIISSWPDVSTSNDMISNCLMIRYAYVKIRIFIWRVFCTLSEENGLFQ